MASTCPASSACGAFRPRPEEPRQVVIMGIHCMVKNTFLHVRTRADEAGSARARSYSCPEIYPVVSDAASAKPDAISAKADTASTRSMDDITPSSASDAIDSKDNSGILCEGPPPVKSGMTQKRPGKGKRDRILAFARRVELRLAADPTMDLSRLELPPSIACCEQIRDKTMARLSRFQARMAARLGSA
mmetsp:Transcript_82550/g.256410  ORF Transcript_82550/g.256410 Transcript_82550/m.256410 type:complete len:189 (+) Transcript_82550:79-645(+)